MIFAPILAGAANSTLATSTTINAALESISLSTNAATVNAATDIAAALESLSLSTNNATVTASLIAKIMARHIQDGADIRRITDGDDSRHIADGGDLRKMVDY